MADVLAAGAAGESVGNVEGATGVEDLVASDVDAGPPHAATSRATVARAATAGRIGVTARRATEAAACDIDAVSETPAARLSCRDRGGPAQP
jgi:hypothetical protein